MDSSDILRNSAPTIVSAPIGALPNAQANPSFHRSARTTREETPLRTGSRRKRFKASVDMARLGDELVRIASQIPVHEVPCPACGNGAFDDIVVRNGFPVVRCRSCRCLFVRARPAEDRLVGIYQRFPQLSGGREGQLIDDPVEGLLEAEYRLRRLREFATAGRLLDVGCGHGDFLLAASRDFDVFGVDLVPRLRPDAQVFNVFHGRLEDAAFPENFFDVVSAVETLEHLFNPRRTLGVIHRILEPRGILLLQTGDVDSIRARLNLKTWTYLQPPIHLNFFSREALRRLAAEVGFEPMKSWSFGRAPTRIPILRHLGPTEVLRPALDWAARAGFLGAMHVWRRREEDVGFSRRFDEAAFIVKRAVLSEKS